MKTVRIDLVIAICALLVSTLATAATWWQSRVVGQQLSAQVWPYVSLVNTLSPDKIEISIANDGSGPAVIKSAILSVDGKPQRTIGQALQAIAGPVPRRRRHVHLTTSSLNPGTVVRPMTTRAIVSFESSEAVPPLLRQLPRARLEICYCSVLDTCWIAATRQDFPVPVVSCPDRSRDELQDNV